MSFRWFLKNVNKVTINNAYNFLRKKKWIAFNICKISLLPKSWADRKNLSFEKLMELLFLKTIISGYLPESVTQTTLELSLYR